jgi:hypothetical protein
MFVICPLSIVPREIIDRAIIHQNHTFDEISNELMVHDSLSNTNHSNFSIIRTNFYLFCMDVEFKCEVHPRISLLSSVIVPIHKGVNFYFVCQIWPNKNILHTYFKYFVTLIHLFNQNYKNMISGFYFLNGMFPNG